ncbi:MAG TPA: CocE/NonD family hydrolase [Candidatus Dormibacteraeota bacterium]|nr:CocE/NonD family hydrolase [Candidatus Dormibacteraeota bacterium]
MGQQLRRIVIDRGVSTPMRDGTVLVSDLYRPDDDARHPVLLTRTPYDRTFPLTAHHSIDIAEMALRGYICMVQDVRGRFGSEGSYETYTYDAKDGFDTIAWITEQPWSDGNVGMFGTSYMAQAQWLAASEQPPALRALAPFQSPHSTTGGDRYRGGALQLGVLAGWATSAIAPPEVMRRAQTDPEMWIEFFKVLDDADNLEEHMRRLPLVPWPPIDERAGGLSPQFDKTVRYEFHPPIPRFQPSDIATPALVFAGWHDVFLQPCLDLFCGIVTDGASEEARRLTRLVVGPWSHGMQSGTVGELNFGIGASGLLLDRKENFTKLHRRWFDARLLGKATGIDDEPRVKVFVMGENRWREMDAWPPTSAKPQQWRIHAGVMAEAPGAVVAASGAVAAAATDVVRSSGTLLPAAPTEPATPSAFWLDPDDPVPTRGGTLMMGQQYIRGPVDQVRTELRDDVLVFTSEPLVGTLTVIGRVTLTAWVAAQTADTDVVARLCDVHPDGRSFNVVDGILRLRFRDGLDRPTPLEPGEVYRVEVDLWSTAYAFLPGHRLRLHVTASDFPRYDRCPGTGQTSADATEILPQRNLLFHDAEHPSHLVLPVVPG